MKSFLPLAISVFVNIISISMPLCLAAQDQKQMIALSRTGQNHVLLAGLAGEWTFMGKHFPPGQKPIEFEGKASRRSIMDGRYFIFETTGGKLEMPWSDGKEVIYRDMIIEGFDNKKQRFVNAMIGNHWNTGIAYSEGIYDSTQRTIIFDSGNEPGSGGKTVIRQRLKILSNDHYVIGISLVTGSQEIKRSEIIYTRVKSAIAGKFHLMLARSNGEWVGTSSMWISPDAAPIMSTSSLVNRMTSDGLYQVSEIIADGPKPSIGVRITGYDGSKKVFTRAMIGESPVFGSVAMEGTWDEVTRSITMPFKLMNQSDKTEQNLKEVYRIIDEDTEILEIYKSDPKTGKEFKTLSVKWTRVK